MLVLPSANVLLKKVHVCVSLAMIWILRGPNRYLHVWGEGYLMAASSLVWWFLSLF